MTNLQPTPAQMADRFGQMVCARLGAGMVELPYSVTERLRAARVQAVAQRKQTKLRTAPSVNSSGGAATLTFGDEHLSLWSRIASALPLIALVAGLFLINIVENDRRAHEVAEVDAALLTDDLPPSAYADPGFLQFLKSGHD